MATNGYQLMNANFWSLSIQNTKNLNKHAVLDLIRFTPGGISRSEAAQRLDLSRAAITTITNDLIESKIIRETEARNSHGGRPAIILEINPRRGYFVGIDMGASHISILLTDFSARVIDDIEAPFQISAGPKACIAIADQLLRDLLEKKGLGVEAISAIGIGVPGPIVSNAGMVIAPPIMPGWDRFPIQETLEKLWGRPIALNNDAELGAIGEWAYGAGRGERNLAYIKVGTGIGSGFLLDGQIYRGATGSAGEIGHLTIDENGPLCNCGNYGCLEALAGGQAIARQAQDAVKNGKRTVLSRIQPLENLTALEVATAARSGDLVAQQIIAQAGGHLGVAIAGIVNLFNPSMIVVGGGVAQIGDLFLQPIRDAVQRRSLPAAVRSLKINTAVLMRRSASLGAVVQASSIALRQIANRKEVMEFPKVR
jgi:glucokinase-like ROK family protein